MNGTALSTSDDGCAVIGMHDHARVQGAGGYPNVLANDDDPERIAQRYGPNADRLTDVQRRDDSNPVSRPAIPPPLDFVALSPG